MWALQLFVSCIILSKESSAFDTNLRVEGSCPHDTAYEEACPSTAVNARGGSVCADVVSIFRPAARVCLSPASQRFKVSIIAEIHNSKVGKGQESLWLTGSGPGLSWEKTVEMEKDLMRAHAWKADIEYTVDSNLSNCHSLSRCTALQRAIEFRLRLDNGVDSEGDMLGPNLYVPLPLSNSMQGVLGTLDARVIVHAWFTGRCQIRQYSRQFKGVNVTFSLHFPPSFDGNAVKRYPLLVILGPKNSQILPPLIEFMYNETVVEEAVVAFVEGWELENIVDQLCAYNPYADAVVWKCKDYASDTLCSKSCQFCWVSDRIRCTLNEYVEQSRRCLVPVPCRPPGGELLLEFVRSQLLAVAKAETNERVLFDPPRHRVSIIGYGVMGLLACHAALTEPHFFAGAGCLSAPLYWPLDQSLGRRRSGLLEVLNSNLPLSNGRKALHATQKYYIDVGERDDVHLPEELSLPLEDARRLIEIMKREYSLSENENIIFAVVPNASNRRYDGFDAYADSESLFHRFRNPFQFFLRPEGGPRINGSWIFNQRANSSSLLANGGRNFTHSLSAPFTCERGISVTAFLCSVAAATLGSVALSVVFVCARSEVTKLSNLRTPGKKTEDSGSTDDVTSSSDEDSLEAEL